MSGSTTEKLREAGVLGSRFADELLGDFYEEYFGGLYEDYYVDGIGMFFPAVKPSEVAFIFADSASAELDGKKLAVLLRAFGLEFGGSALDVPLASRLREVPGLESVIHASSGAENFFGELEGLLWSFHLNGEGTLLALHVHDLGLIAANSTLDQVSVAEIREILRSQMINSIRDVG
jgi:hypothetical protein